MGNRCPDMCDLVFMDCQMPEMDGFEATKVIRSEYSTVKNHDVPIIALTANVTKHDQEACTDVGMNDFISKPATKEKLASILGKWLENSNSVNFSVPYSNQSELSSF